MKSVFHLRINGEAVEALAPVHVTRVLRQLAGLSVAPHRWDPGDASVREIE